MPASHGRSARAGVEEPRDRSLHCFEMPASHGRSARAGVEQPRDRSCSRPIMEHSSESVHVGPLQPSERPLRPFEESHDQSCIRPSKQKRPIVGQCDPVLDQVASLSSTTDKDLERRRFFTEKDRTNDENGDAEKLFKSIGVGYSCMKGMKPESPNQDSFSALYVKGKFGCYGVYDGHGPFGHDVSEFVKENLMKLFRQKLDERMPVEDALKTSFTECQRLLEDMKTKDGNTIKFNPQKSGTTVTIAYRPEGEDHLFIAHVGDSRAIIVKKNGDSPHALTEDHKPNLPKEKTRIEKAGGRVVFDDHYNYRICVKNGMYPGLNMSRAIGDVASHKDCGLTAEPDICKYEIDKDKDLALLICTDGVWEFMESDKVARIIYENAQPKKGKRLDCSKVAADLNEESFGLWMENSECTHSDDITAMLVML